MIRPTVTFCHSLRTSGNANDEPLPKIALWRIMLFCFLGKNSYTYSKMFDYYIYAFALIHFDCSVNNACKCSERFFCATQYNADFSFINV